MSLGAGAVASALFAWTLLRWAGGLLVPAYDTAFFQQVVWNLGHGGGFSSGFWPASFLGLHFEPLLVLPAALERAWPDARLLSILQAIALGATAPAAYLLLSALLRPPAPTGTLETPGPGSRRATEGDGDRRRWVAAALAAPVPLWAAVQQAARAGFHTEALALPLLLLAGWAGLRGRTALCWALALLALTAKEDQAYAVAVLGALLLWHGPSRRQGAALAAVAIAYGAAVEWAVMPALRGGVTSQVDPYYRWLHTASPGQVAAALANPGGWLALAGIVAGLAGLPLLRPAWLALALPPLAADLLSAHHPQPELRLQYALPLVLPLLVAAGLAARHLPPRLPAPAVAALAVPALLIGALAGPVLGQRGAGPEPALERLRLCAASMPAAASVAADDSAAAALASRPELRLLTEARPGDFVVVDRSGPQPAYVWLPDRERVLVGLAAQGRRLRCDDGRFQLWSPAGG